MKKFIVLIIALTLLTVKNFAQNEKFLMALGKSLGQFQAAKTAEDYTNTANAFARIANAEPNEWLPKYYAAHCRLLAGYELTKTDMAGAQELAKTALVEIQAAEKLAPMETELMVLEAFAYQLQLIENPMANGQIYTPKIYQALGKAQAINADNPRIYMVRGEFTLNMPEFYGGGAAKATPDIQKAAEKFETFKPASPFSPNWGKEHNAGVAKRIEVMAAVKGK